MKDGERRITITCYDKEGFDLVSHYPLYKFFETAEETGLCVCSFTENRMAYVEKTKAGYVIRAWRDERNE